MPSSRMHGALAGAVLLNLVSVGLAHGQDEDASMRMKMVMNASDISSSLVNGTSEMWAPSYFRHVEYSWLMLLHIVLMSIAWVFVLPLGIMFSIGRSHLYLPMQFTFLFLNAIGLVFGVIYNNSTPNLYPNNAHHGLGWVLICIACAQTMMALLQAFSDKTIESYNVNERTAFIPISSRAMEEHQRMNTFEGGQDYRFSNDSGHGTGRTTESSRSNSTSSDDGVSENRVSNVDLEYQSERDPNEKYGDLKNIAPIGLFVGRLHTLLSSKTKRALKIVHNAVNRVILILGFIALTTGIVAYSGIFRGGGIFSGLAHFIKGGVFFWYGILTLGRWAGCFAELGWAWNIRPSWNSVKRRKWAVPSAEFVESFLIFFYGSTNVFLEHLGGWGGEWSSGDLEHISITIMFFGGGLCGMLVESQEVRDLLNASVIQDASGDRANLLVSGQDGDSSWQIPKSYMFSMNPIPALIVLLLGLMMSSHHQASMVASMVHKQWGTLLVGAAFARALTYVIFYLSPPVSILPSRPPTELITSFGLIAGGLIFMASAHDIVVAMEVNELDAMFTFTVSMGIVTFLMAWIVFVIAVKGWAVRKEYRRNFS